MRVILTTFFLSALFFSYHHDNNSAWAQISLADAKVLYQQHLANTESKFKKDLENGWGTNGRTSFVRILYWPNMNMGFGHVVLEAFPNKSSAIPEIYVSFAMGNDMLVDLQKHGMLPEVIELPTFSEENFHNFVNWFKSSPYIYPRQDGRRYGDDYTLTGHNCAHAVLNCMEKFGYKFRRNYSICRPSVVRSIALNLAKP